MSRSALRASCHLFQQSSAEIPTGNRNSTAAAEVAAAVEAAAVEATAVVAASISIVVKSMASEMRRVF